MLGTASFIQSSALLAAIASEAGTDGGFVAPNTPNMVDFLIFLGTSVGIPAQALPLGSPWPQYAFTQVLNLTLAPGVVPGILYSLAVYNGATHLLMAITPDQPGQNYFVTARSTSGFSLVTPSTGLVVASTDEGTSVTLESPEWAKRMTVDQLQYFRTPWGRTWLQWQQSYGPTIVALT